jgi:hypothetical protein
MTNEARMTEPENSGFSQNIFWSFEPLSFLPHSTFVLRHLRLLAVLASIFYLPTRLGPQLRSQERSPFQLVNDLVRVCQIVEQKIWSAFLQSLA